MCFRTVPMANAYPLPIVQSPHIAGAAERLESCKTGGCGNCGLCCVTMETTVPSIRGDIDSKPVRKPAGHVCPQLVRSTHDRYMCALYGFVQAGDTRVGDCAEWSGRGNGFAQLVAQTEQVLEAAPTQQAVAMMRDLTRMGVLAGFERITEYGEAVEIARHYLFSLGTCPTEVFRLLHVDAAFREMYQSGSARYFGFDRELWEHSPDLYLAFFEDCVWNGRGPYMREQLYERVGP